MTMDPSEVGQAMYFPFFMSSIEDSSSSMLSDMQNNLDIESEAMSLMIYFVEGRRLRLCHQDKMCR